MFRHLVSHNILKRTLNISTKRHFKVSPILLRYLTTPDNFNHELFWLRKLKDNKYAYGITNNYGEEHGDPQMVFLEVDINDVLMEGDSFAILENEKAVIPLEAPFDSAKLVEFNEDIDFDIVNEDPENIDNRICVFENTNSEIGTNSNYDFNNTNFKMPLL